MLNQRENNIIDFIKINGPNSSKEIFESIDISVSYATLKRILGKLIEENYLSVQGLIFYFTNLPSHSTH